MLFSTYGPVLDVVALRTMNMRGQAHIVFRDVQAATQAMRSLDGEEFLGRDLVSVVVCLAHITLRLTMSFRKFNTPNQSQTSSLSSTVLSSRPTLQVPQMLSRQNSNKASLTRRPPVLLAQVSPRNLHQQWTMSCRMQAHPIAEARSAPVTRMTRVKRMLRWRRIVTMNNDPSGWPFTLIWLKR